jgi:hypothetical protein
MFIPNPDFYPSRVSDPKNKKKEGGKKILHNLFCCHKCHKIETYFIFELVKKKIWASLQRILELPTQKIGIKLSKIWFGIRDLEKTYSGSHIQGSKRHRITDL